MSASGIEITHQAVAVAKTRRLPSVSTSLTAGYLGDVTVIQNAINNTIATASLQEQISQLNLEEDILDVKLLVAAHYFDIYTLYNQRAVYNKNIELAALRFEQIQKLYKPGMVTRNDVISSELQLADLKLARQVVDNNLKIINKRLTTATSLSSNIMILPDTTTLMHN